MTTFLALLKDSLRQTVDNKVFIILLVLASLVILACFLVSFTEEGISILFGLWKIEYSELELSNSPEEQDQSMSLKGFSGKDLSVVFVYGALNIIQGAISGVFGIIFAIIVTSFFVPEMLRRGSIDLVLSKPISRAKILFTKYLGGLIFVFLISLYVGVGIWLAFGISSGIFFYGFLITIVHLTVYFAFLYAVSVLFGVMTRSSIASILLTFVVWIIWSTVNTFRAVLFLSENKLSEKGFFKSLELPLDVLYWIFPKLTELELLSNSIQYGCLTEEQLEIPFIQMGIQQSSLLLFDTSIGRNSLLVLSSLGFLALTLGIALWKFKKTDY